jgi:hypothetical protein
MLSPDSDIFEMFEDLPLAVQVRLQFKIRAYEATPPQAGPISA